MPNNQNNNNGGSAAVRRERKGNGAPERGASLYPNNGSGAHKWRTSGRSNVEDEARKQEASPSVVNASPVMVEARGTCQRGGKSINIAANSSNLNSSKAPHGSKRTAGSPLISNRHSGGPDERGNEQVEIQVNIGLNDASVTVVGVTSSSANGRGATIEKRAVTSSIRETQQNNSDMTKEKPQEPESRPEVTTSRVRLETSNAAGSIRKQRANQAPTASGGHRSPSRSAASARIRATRAVPSLYSFPASTVSSSAGSVTTRLASDCPVSTFSSRSSAQALTACGQLGSRLPDRTSGNSSIPSSCSRSASLSYSRRAFSGGSSSPSLTMSFAPASCTRPCCRARVTSEVRRQPDPPQAGAKTSPVSVLSSGAPKSSSRLSCSASQMRSPLSPKAPAATLPSAVSSTSAFVEEEPAILASLRKELTCAICLELLQLPVTVDCGHTFCRYCITHNKINRRSCPLCRQALSLSSSLSINTVLANLLTLLGMRRGKKGGFAALTLGAKATDTPETQGKKTVNSATTGRRDVTPTGSTGAVCLSAERAGAETQEGCTAADASRRPKRCRCPETEAARDREVAPHAFRDERQEEPENQKELSPTTRSQVMSAASSFSPLEASSVVPHGSSVSGDDPLEPAVVVRAPTAEWWSEACVKPQMAMPLVLRLLMRDLGEDSVIFFDDLVGCVVEEFDKKDLWSFKKWIFTLNDLVTFSQLVRFDRNDKTASQERIRLWVEDYVFALPRVCSRRFVTDPVSGCHGRIVMRVLPDPQHKIEARVVDSADLRHCLPWDLGRHHQSLIQIPHSSVSLSHLQLLRQPGADADELAVLDLGSTIGTMLLIEGTHTLHSGDVIHIGDRIEVAVEIVPARLFRRLEKRKQRQGKVNKEAVRRGHCLDLPEELFLSGQDGEYRSCRRRPYNHQLSLERACSTIAEAEIAGKPHTKVPSFPSFAQAGEGTAASEVSVGHVASGTETTRDPLGKVISRERLDVARGFQMCTSYTGLFSGSNETGPMKWSDERADGAARRAASVQCQQPLETHGMLFGERIGEVKSKRGDREASTLERRRLRKLIESVSPNPFLDMHWSRSQNACFRIPRQRVKDPVSRPSHHKEGARQSGPLDSNADWSSRCHVPSSLLSSSHSYQRDSPGDSSLPSRFLDSSMKKPLGRFSWFRTKPLNQGGRSVPETNSRFFVPYEDPSGVSFRAEEIQGTSADSGRLPMRRQSQARYNTSSSMRAPSWSSPLPRRDPIGERPRRREASAPAAGGGTWGHAGERIAARGAWHDGGGVEMEESLPHFSIGSAGVPSRSGSSMVLAGGERGAPHCQSPSCVEDPFTDSRCLKLNIGDSSAHADENGGHEDCRGDRTCEKKADREVKGEEGRVDLPAGRVVTEDKTFPCLLRSPSASLSSASSVYAGTAESISFSSPRRELLRSSPTLPCDSQDPTHDGNISTCLGPDESEADLSDDSVDRDLSNLVRPGDPEPLDSFLLLRFNDASPRGVVSRLPSVSSVSVAGGDDAQARSRNESEPAEGDGDSLKDIDKKASSSLSLLPSGYTEWAPPTGVVLGRGPHNPMQGFKKIAVTANNGYISRVHCLIYYDGSRPPNQRWLLKDSSTLGTYLRLKPFEPQPCPLRPKCILKVGQCKVEISLRGSASPVPASANFGGTGSSLVASQSSNDVPLTSVPFPTDSSSTSVPPSSSRASAPPPGAASAEGTSSSEISTNLRSQRPPLSILPSSSPQSGLASLSRLPLLNSSHPEGGASHDNPRSAGALTTVPLLARGNSGTLAQTSQDVRASTSRSVSPVHSFFSGMSFMTSLAHSASSNLDLSNSALGGGNNGRGSSPPTTSPRVTPSSSVSRLSSFQLLQREPSMVSLQFSQSPSPLRLTTERIFSSTPPVSRITCETGQRTQANTRGDQSRVYASDRGSGGEQFSLTRAASSPSGGLRVLTIASSDGHSSSVLAPF